MANAVIMPKAGMSMETGKIVKWLKNEGDRVQQGEPLLEIETDKVNMEVEAMYSGVLLKALAHEGDEVPVVQTIGYIGEAGEAIPVAGAAAETEKPAEKPAEAAPVKDAVITQEGMRIPATPAAKRLAKEKGISLESITPSGSLGQVKAADVEAGGTVKATPLAKAMAVDMGIDLKTVHGSGFGGKVTKADIASTKESEAASAGIYSEDTLVPHSAMRKVIAKRMLQSHTNIPPVTQNCLADVTALMALREQINAGSKNNRITVNDFIVMAVAKALREQPHINASYTEAGLLLKKHINIGVAVALPEGLIVPVIRDADTLKLNEISATAKELQGKAKEGRLTPDDYTGGTFTISNLGMMGVTAFTPIVNEPESAILGVCATEQRLEMDTEGNISRRQKMTLCLTYDHRSIDGAQAAIFSNRVIQLLENPLEMLV
jgi:pyruvate dehydrogenase E2 component (dihydrolipoamide acetyltransferase)